MVRVAVVQLAFHPAVAEVLEDPLFDPKSERSSLRPEGASVMPPEIQESFKELRGRVRKAYVAQLGRRIEVILDHCKRWKVRIVVFPEYSIPHELLERMAAHAPDIVIVAGTHFVDSESRRSEVYQRLGATSIPVPRNAVCPVLYQTKALSMGAKIHPVDEEVKLKFVPGKEWRAIEMPDGIESPMGVLICRDLLQRDSASHRSVIAERLESCRFLAVPSLTPSHTVEEFLAKCWEQARRLRRPVLYANDATGGGTSVYVDEGRRVDLENYPLRAGLLSAGEEGMIVADVNLGYEWLGDSTPYDKPLPVVPFAATTFVYRGRDHEYAQWLDDLGPLLAERDGDEFEQTEAIRLFLQSRPVTFHGVSKTRQRRLQQLVLDADNLPGVEYVRLLTREVVFPADTLPLSALRAALARGAADVLDGWVSQKNLGQFGPVVQRLRDAWAKMKQDAWAPDMKASARLVSDQVAGDAKQKSSPTLLAKVAAYDAIVRNQFEDALREAVEFLQKEDFAEGKQRLERIVVNIDAEIAKNGSSNDLVQQRARCQMYIGFATLNLQEMAKAREILLGVDPNILIEKARLQWIAGLVVVGEVERVRALLPAKENVAPDALPMWEEAKQSMMLADGIIPDPLVSNENVRLRAAEVYLEQNNDAMAAQLALEVLQQEQDFGLTQEIATHTLYAALSRTVYDWPIAPNPPATRIPCDVATREPIVQHLEESFSKLRAARLPEATRQHLRKLEHAFRALTKDYDALAAYGKEALEDFEEDEPSHPNFADRDRAFDLVRKGDVDEALRILPPDPHPWRRRADEVELLAHGKRFEQALEKAIALEKEFPDRPRIECALAELYAIAKNHKASTVHARRAFVALPGIGYRLQFVQSLNHIGRLAEAFELLQNHLDDERAQVQRMIGVTALMLDKRDQAEQAWKRYAEKVPNDWTALANLAQVQVRQHRLEDAAATSYLLFEKHGDNLTAEVLYQCGIHQATGLALESVRKARIAAISKKMHERFPKDVKAERLRLQLLSSLGDIPAEVDPIDFDALVKAGHGVWGVGFSTLIEQLKARNTFLDVVAEAAKKGALPITTMLRLANNDPATFLTRLWDGVGPSEGWLCPPVSMMDEPTAAQLPDATILVGQVEFLLLLQLDLLGPLQKSLAPNGRILLFTQVREQMLADAVMLRTRSRPEKLEFVETLIRKLEKWNEATLEERVPVVRWESTDPKALELRDQRGPSLSPHATLRFLRKTGVLTADELARLEKDLGLKSDSEPVLLEAMPQRFAFCWSILDNLDEVGVLEKVQRAFPQQLVLEPGTLNHFRKKRNRLREEIAAAKLADRAHDLLAREKLQFLPAPSVNEVPRLRDSDSDYFEDIIRKPLREVVAYKKAALAEANRWRLTAEYFGTTNLGFPDTPRQLDWSNEQQYKVMMELVRRGTARDITFPSVVRYLARNEAEADTKLRSLALLGFADALGPGELLRLDKQYEGLAGAEPKRLLDAMEWMARHPQHLAGDSARLRIAHTYGAAVFNAYGATDRSEQESFRVLEQLFGRLERLGEETKTDPLDTALTVLAEQTAIQWQSAWKLNEENTHMRMDPGAPTLRIWFVVHSWCQANLVRRSALGRATRTLLSTVSQHPGGPPDAVVKTLLVLLPELQDVDKQIFLLEPAHEAFGILSSRWTSRAFAETDPGDLIERSGEHFSAGAMHLHGGRSARASVRFENSESSVRVAIPVEALLLRLSSAEKSRIVEHVQREQGPFDGVAYEFLERIRQNPADEAAQLDYALYATNALFRLVQDDPSYLIRWQKGHWQDEQSISPLVFLLKILSEPNEPLPDGLSLFQILHDRANDEPGKDVFWIKHRRAAAGALLVIASEIPGLFPPLGYVRHRLESPQYEREVERALSTITDSEKHPIARVANEAYFLRVAASRRPHLVLGGNKIDLRDELPRYLEGLLERVIADPPPDTMAFFEPALLRACGGVIQRLALPDHTPLREGIFWTYRLFQWLCLQLEAISPDARLDGMRRLAALAPPVNNPHDILDPFGFGRNDLDIRLTTVLHTLAHLHILDLPEGVDNTNLEKHTPARVSTPKIEQCLLELAQKSDQGPRLGTVFQDWHFPGNIPDMALYTLLNVNSARFADMSEESRLRRFEAIPKNLEVIDKEHEGERLLWDLVLAAALNHAESLSTKERRLVETKIREMEESPQAARYRRGMAVTFFAAGETQLEAEAFTRVLEDPNERDLGSMLGALFLVVANREPLSLEAVVRTTAQRLAEKGADEVLWLGRGLARVVNMGKPEARKVTRDLLLKLAKEKPFADDMRMRELLTTFNIREDKH